MNRFTLRASLIVSLTATALALGAGQAQAGTATLGSPMSIEFTQQSAGSMLPIMFTNTTLPEAGAVVASPIDGTVVRWRVALASGGPYYLVVLRPDGGGNYTAINRSAPQIATTGTTDTFETSQPIKAGDLVALRNTNSTDKLGLATPVPGATLSAFLPLVDGQSGTPTNIANTEIGFNADVQSVPTLMSLSQSTGSVEGGDEINIGGTDFIDVKSVSFGSTPAKSFSVDFSGQVTAIAPAAAALGPVDVTVTTPAGTTAVTPASSFTYEGCVVPNVKNKKLKKAKKSFKKADCKLGKVKGKKSKSAKVRKQSPTAGSLVSPGTKVNVKVK